MVSIRQVSKEGQLGQALLPINLCLADFKVVDEDAREDVLYKYDKCSVEPDAIDDGVMGFGGDISVGHFL